MTQAREKVNSWFERGRYRLYPYRPRLWDWHFWMVQGLVIVIAVGHSFAEAGGLLHNLGVPYFIPISLFLVPVVYAALAFGFAGGLATALWATVITIPNFIFWHHGLERFGVMFQMLIVITVAFFVGQRVDRERRAWQQAESTATELKASRIKYQSLFESSPIAILILGPNGDILEANPAASILFARNKPVLEGMRIADLLGAAEEQKLLDSSQNGRGLVNHLTFKLDDSSELYLEPTAY